MPYPDDIDRFPSKLNRKPDGGMHAVEERITLTDGKYDGPLAHDNIANNSVRVYTGPSFSGVELTNFTVSIPGDMPWRRHLKIFSAEPAAYVTYETPGDQVEAADINAVQAAVTATQEELDRFKSEGVLDGGAFYEGE